MRLVYSEEAVADLVRSRAFIAQNDPSAASRIAAKLVSRVENLRVFPEMGRNVTSAPGPGSVRDAVFGNYVIRYTAHAGAVIVLRLWHHYENRLPTAD